MMAISAPRVGGAVAASVQSPPARVSAADPSTISNAAADIAGALANGMRCIGVLYGFGGHDELRAAGAERIVATPDRIAKALAPPVSCDRS